MADEINQLKKEISLWQGKYRSMKQKYMELEQSTIKYRIRKRTDSFWSIVAVFLNSSEQGTSLPRKLNMFFKTMWAWARSGFKLSSEQTSQARFEICKACPELVNNKQCNLCGCFMEKKVKIESASCPLKKW